MTSPTSDLPLETSPSQNPSILQDKEDQPDPHSDSQSYKTLILDIPDPQKPVQSDPNPVQLPQEQANPHDPLNEEQANPLDADDPDTVSALSPRNTDTNVGVSNATSRRGSKWKKLDKKRIAREKKTETKLQVLVQTLKPIPFIPVKALDFSRHEKLLKRLGLWDFVHVEFDRSINGDLIAQLIARYKPNLRDSYVNGLKVCVRRADLARALKLPVKKSAVSDGALEGLELAESIGFIEEFVSNWVLLHEDTWIMPDEVVSSINMIKEGNLEKVDWTGLIWFMVEKELVASSLTNCYYASHLQQLIRSQREELLIEKPKMEVEIKDDEEEDEDEEEDGSGDLKMGGIDDSRGQELEEDRIELCLGQDNVDKAENQNEPVGVQEIMDFEEAKEEDTPMQWLLDGKNNLNEPFLRHCHIGAEDLSCSKAKKNEEDEEGLEEEEEEEEEAEEDEHEVGFHLSPNIPLEGMSSGSLIQTMEVSQMPFNSGIELRDHLGGEFLSSREDTRLTSGASTFSNGNKRETGHDNLNPHHPLNGSNKRLRTDGMWDGKSSDFDVCMVQVQHWMEKARIMYAAKDQACEESSMNQQYLINEVQERDNMIEHLHKAKIDESQNRLAEIYRLERELHMMGNLVEGYRKALKETQRAFADYRVRCPQRDEPLYKDVPGSGGLVLSTMELEKLRLKQEEEERMNRLVHERKCRDFELGWIAKLEDCQNRVQSLDNRLLDAERVVKLLTEVKTRKGLDSSECTAIE